MPVGSLAGVLDTIDNSATPPHASGAVGHGGGVVVVSGVVGEMADGTDVLVGRRTGGGSIEAIPGSRSTRP
jgi:hypothetical protein